MLDSVDFVRVAKIPDTNSALTVRCIRVAKASRAGRAGGAAAANAAIGRQARR
jgi:hypothetical protein